MSRVSRTASSLLNAVSLALLAIALIVGWSDSARASRVNSCGPWFELPDGVTCYSPQNCSRRENCKASESQWNADNRPIDYTCDCWLPIGPPPGPIV